MRILLTLASALSLSACGLSPMYAGGGSGEVAQGLAAVDVPPIPGKAGWLVRNALVRIHAGAAVIIALAADGGQVIEVVMLLLQLQEVKPNFFLVTNQT